MAQFFRIYCKAKIANSKDELADIASEISSYYIARALKRRQQNSHFETLDSCLSTIDLSTAIGVIGSQNRMTITLNAISIPILLIMAKRSSSRVHIMLSGISNTFPLSKFFNSSILSFGLPFKSYSFGLSLAVSSVQVLGNRLGSGFTKFNVYNYFSSVLAVGGINFAVSKISHYLSQLFFSFPPFIISDLISYSISDYVYSISVFGVDDYIEHIFESIANFFYKKDDMPIDIDDDTPDSLRCPICKELYCNPVECLGFFFCRNCIDRWLSNHNTLPSTGEQISKALVKDCILLNIVSQKYHRMVLNGTNI